MKIAVNLGDTEKTALTKLQTTLPWANTHALVRLAARVGFAILQDDPERVVALLSEQRVRFVGR
jgi:hypothetical protein